MSDKQEVVNLRLSALVNAKQKLAEFKIQSREDIEKARLTYESDEVSLRDAERNLEHTIIRSPTDGLVSLVAAHPGELVEQGTLLLTLSDQVVFKAYVDQARLNAVKVGDRSTVRLVAYPGETFSGTVTQVNPTVESTIGSAPKVGLDRRYTYSAWIKLDDLRITPGLQGYAEFARSQASVVIPESAVIHLSSREGMVLRVRDDRVDVRKVELGRTRGGSREVLGGLEPGQAVALHPRALRPSDRVRAPQPKG